MPADAGVDANVDANANVDVEPHTPSAGPAWPDHCAACYKGQYDTHKEGARNQEVAGKPYDVISLGDLWTMAEIPDKLPKEKALAVLASSYHQHDARDHSVQREHGQFVMVRADVDGGNHSLPEVTSAVHQFAGDAAGIFYSTSSATIDKRKWRVILALENPLSFPEWHQLQRAFNLALSQKGISVDLVTERAGQHMYGPNQGDYYQFKRQNGNALDVMCPGVTQALADLKAKDAEIERSAQEARQRAQERRAARNSTNGTPGADAGVVDAFRARYTVSELFDKYGFETQNDVDWHHPELQTSHSYSWRDFGDAWVCVSDTARREKIGAVSANDFGYGDQFDLYAHFEHQGNFTAAVHAAAKEFGMAFDVTAPPLTLAQALAEVTDFDAVDQSANSDDHAQTDKDSDLDTALLATRMPELAEHAFYGPLRHIVEAATANSEATRTGVAMHLLTSITAHFGWPFYVNIGDEKVGLNLYSVQVGPSAVARKGTSAATADRRLMPALRQRAAKLAQDTDAAREKAMGAIMARNRAQADLERLQDRRDVVELMGPEDVAEVQERIEQAKADILKAQERVDFLKGKLDNAELSPKTEKEYTKALADASLQVFNLESQVARDLAEVERIEAIIADPETALKDIDADIEACKKVLTQPTVVAPEIEPWVAVLSSFAGHPIKMGTLSSGEGVVWAIRDDTTDKEGELVPGIKEKRMFINMSELGGALTVMRRPGNSLGAVIRDAYDGVALSTTGKVEPCSVQSYTCSMSASITPAELAGLMFDTKDTQASADNGVGNRPLYVFCRRNKLVSRPLPTDGVEEIADVVWGNISRVYAELQPASADRCVEIPFSDAGAAEWDANYGRLDGMRGSSDNAAKLHGRLTTNCRKVAAVLALIAGESEVGPECVKAAMAWVEYSSLTIDVIASSITARATHSKIRKQAERVWNVIRNKTVIDDDGVEHYPTRKIVQQTTSYKADAVLAALDYLTKQAPPLVRIIEKLGGNHKTTAYLQAIGVWR